MRRILLILPLLAGLAAGLALTLPSVARAWDINALPTGYTIVGHIKNGDCTTYQIRGYGAAIDLSNCREDFQSALDTFIDSTCPTSVCHPVTTTATTSADTTPVTTAIPVDTTSATTTSALPVDTTTTTAAPPNPPTVTQTVIVQTTLTDPTITQRLDLLEQRQATDEARITALEHPTGQILGEPKNVAPFVAAL